MRDRATKRGHLALLTMALTAVGCSDPAAPGLDTVALEPVAQGLTGAVYVTAPADDTERLFVVRRGGIVSIVRDGAPLATPFLDLTGAVAQGDEQGLLSIAFHPAYASNGYAYASYTNTDGDTRIVRYTVSADPDQLDPTTADTLLALDQPFTNHNGGLIAFGPDGYLYVGLGDGGSGNEVDPDDNGQTLATLLGSLLRLDVDGGSPYAIPADNPFAGQTNARPEAWAYGLRNPWRFSFDRVTGDLYIADVGQSALEEVNFQPAASPGGENYGWRVMEGSLCHDPASGCNTSGLALPIYEYGHAEGCSVTGGYAYRGSAYPTLEGRYFFADFCGGWIRSFVVMNGVAQDVQDHTGDLGTLPQITSFGEDGVGELYVVSLGGGVWKLTAP
ncbi:MAG: PQQ-dependent sugar dehydrogenase [Gemmatimonadota bacterium]